MSSRRIALSPTLTQALSVALPLAFTGPLLAARDRFIPILAASFTTFGVFVALLWASLLPAHRYRRSATFVAALVGGVLCLGTYLLGFIPHDQLLFSALPIVIPTIFVLLAHLVSRLRAVA